MASINLIDPTNSNLAGNTDYQNLFIYVDMTAERKGNTSFNTTNNTVTTSGVEQVNLLGYKVQNGNNIFTSDYTLIYNDENIFEGFGIKSIQIETNASYVPKIIVDFVDIKGMSFFNNPNESPYSILFDFPPPIFTLKIKGYYGKTLEYKLHMLRHNTKFDAEDGNFYITAEFVGNTFAPLTDILFQNVLLVSKLTNDNINVDSKRTVNTLAGLVAKSKTIKNDLIEDVVSSDEYKQLELQGKIFQEKRNSFEFKYKLPVNSGIVILNKTTLTQERQILLDSSKYELIKSEISLQDLGFFENFEYYIVSTSPEIITSSITTNPEVTKINQIFGQLFSNFNTNKGSIVTNKEDIQIFWNSKNHNIKIDLVEGLNPKINYLNITNNLRDVISEMKGIEDNYLNIYKTIDDQVKNKVIGELGFIPTIKNVMTIIANDIDKWIDQLVEVYNESSQVINTNTELRRIYNSEDKIYPFPDFVENNKKTVPKNGSLSQLPEVRFTDKFIENFIDYKENIRLEEARDTSNLVGNNNENIWIPVNPLDSSSLSDSVNPYIGLTTVDEIFSVLFARLYVFYYYTHNTENINNGFIISNNLVRYFFYNEKNVIMKSITDNKLLTSFQNEIKKVNTTTNEDFKNTFRNIRLNYISINNIKNNLLSSFGYINSDSSKDNFIGGITFKNIESTPKISTDDSFWNSIKLFINNNLESDFIPRKYIPEYPIKRIESNEIGMTINSENNILFNDGGENISGFISASDKSNEIEKIILSSINSVNSKNNSRSGLKLRGYIYNIIKDYYFNYKNDNYSKLYGALNILYVPDLKIIDDIVLTQPLTVNMPVLTKLYLSSIAYVIENNQVDFDLNYLDSTDISLIDSNNTEVIYNIYNINYPTSLSNRVVDNFINYRSIIFNKFRNLSPNDLRKYSDFFRSYAENNTIVDLLSNYVLSLFPNGSTGNKLTNIDITPLDFLFLKTTIINSTKITYNDFYPFSPNFYGDSNITETKLKSIFTGHNFALEQIRILFSDLRALIPNEIENRPNGDNINNIKSNQEIRIETYYSFKNFVDRWLTINESNRVTRNNIFLLGAETGLIDTFQFIDRASNPNVAENAIIDITILQEFENDYSVNMLTVISKLLNENGFEFYPLQNFMAFNTSTWNVEEVFTPQIANIDVALNLPRFTCMYVGGTSKYLNSTFNSKSSFKNDGILNIETDSPDFSDVGANTFGFRVKFGDGKQSIFSKIEVSTEEVQPTNESLKSMSLILDNSDKNAVNLAQNLFSTYEQRSYICRVTMFGNSMIQPTQYFMLENIPMFSGLYLILKVTHSIDGETNSMMTTFEGVRLPKEPRPFITNSFDVYVKNYIDKAIIEPSVSIPSEIVEQKINVEKKDRIIHLVAGHYSGDNGAFSNISGENIFEKDLTINLRNTLKQILDTKKIENTIDDDNLSLSQVITDLNRKVKLNDIVLDIHFNASERKDATGVEVLIKDTSNSEIINLAKEIANTISNTLSLTLRTGNKKYKLPSGVKTQAESARGDLGIFNVNCTVILIEVCFMTNFNDYNSYIRNKNRLVNELGKLFENVVINQNEKNLLNLSTYQVLNTLKYDNLNNRNTPSVIDDVNTFNNLIGFTDFTNTKNGITYSALNLKAAYTNSDNISYKNTIRTQLALTSNKYNIDAIFLGGILYIESLFNPVAISSTGALGIGQFIINAAMSDVLDYLNRNKNVVTSVYTYNSNTNQYEFTQRSYEQILNLMFNNNSLSDITFGDNTLRRQLENKKVNNTTYYDILVNNIFNNPFIMIELAALYLKILETKRVGTNINKNTGILSLSYNTGIHKLRNQNTATPYFDHIKEYYNKTPREDIKNRLSGNVRNEGIFYPERLINEYISKFINVDLTKSNLY